MRQYVLLLFTLLLIAQSAHAQNREDEARDDLNYGNARRAVQDTGGDLWYGAGATLGFSATNYSSVFRIGVSPIVGYKINNFLSVGPRASLIYNRFHYEETIFNPEINDNSFTWSTGLFTRAKVFRGFFVHAEYSLVSEKQFVVDQNTNGIVSERRTRAIPFLGAGLSQGGGVGATGFEFLVLFRVNSREYVNDAPYEIRTGINYNF